MSLLLDALKKAEEAKRQGGAAAGNGGATAPGNGRELSLESVAGGNAAAATPASALPELSDHLAAVDADLAAVSAAPPLRPAAAHENRRPPPAAGEAAADQEAVRNVFAAKQTPQPGKAPLWIALGVLAIAGLGVGGWVWWQLLSVGNGSLAARPAPALPVSPPAATPASTAATLPPSPAAIPAPPPAEAIADSAGGTPARAATTDVRSEAASPRADAPREAESPIRISRGQLRVAPALARGYEQLQNGDLVAAAASYEQALRNDPKNVDALLGIAVIAQQRGQTAAAEEWYLRALEADPRDVNALAALINLHGKSDPTAAESRLKGLLAGQPESAFLNFALGNIYSGQQRWPEAQLAYFNAHTADPGNPDYLFNLAASLDQMHQPRIALDYYQQALAASSGRRPNFDTDQVRARIAELQR